MSHPSASLSRQWPLPAEDDWSTPFAEVLLTQLDLRPGLTILDIACGHGIPAFYLAEQVGPTGSVLGIDASRGQVANARTLQRGSVALAPV
ncbi:MAG: methyltransferase domain-containing protein [Nitrospira sp.]